MKTMLFIDACVSDHESRTKRLCNEFLDVFLEKHSDTGLEVVSLEKSQLMPLYGERLYKRQKYVKQKNYKASIFDLAKQFRDADYIVIGAPYWDFSFPSLLKIYFENIMVPGLTFESTPQGFKGLCHGEKLYYITTAGGFIIEKNFGYDYACEICDALGITRSAIIKAEGLDIEGFDAEKIVNRALRDIKEKY